MRYTRRQIVPRMKETLEEFGISGRLLGGHHTGIDRPVRFMGADFHPDIAVMFREQRLIAFEVKILTGAGRGGSVATALGQASVYRLYAAITRPRRSFSIERKVYVPES